MIESTLYSLFVGVVIFMVFCSLIALHLRSEVRRKLRAKPGESEK